MFLITDESLSIIGCSGDITIYVAPKSVSGLVVYTVRVSPVVVVKSTSAPVERPIQFFC